MEGGHYMKQAKVSISLELIEAMCRQSESPCMVITKNALPTDATIVDCVIRGGHGKQPLTLECVVASESFADVAPLMPMPTLPPVTFQ